jgi:hypothetical protein
MYSVIMHRRPDRRYYSVTLKPNDESHFLNIHINEENGSIYVSVSKSQDGFYFKSPCDEAADLEVNPSNSFEETCDYVKNHFLTKGYKFHSS